MAISMRGSAFGSEAESLSVMTEGTAGIAVVVLAVLGLAKVSPDMFASIVTILIGAGLMVEAWTIAAEDARTAAAEGADRRALTEVGVRSLISGMVGLTGLILGILALVGINAVSLVSSALIVFGGGLLLNAASATLAPGFSAGEGEAEHSRGSVAVKGFEAMVGVAGIVLGILALILSPTWVLPLVGFIAVGAALLLTSATFGAGVSHMFASHE